MGMRGRAAALPTSTFDLESQVCRDWVGTTTKQLTQCSSHLVPTSSKGAVPGHQREETLVLGTLEEEDSPLSEEKNIHFAYTVNEIVLC